MNELFFKFWDLNIAVVLEDNEFCQSICDIWKAYQDNPIEKKGISYRYRLEKTDLNRYTLISNNSPPSQIFQKEQVLPFLNSQLCFNLLQSSKSHFYFHSSAFLKRDNSIVLLMGDRGNGKTSLLLGMLKKGDRFICNDIFPLMPKTNLGEPFLIGFFAEKSILNHFPDFANIQLGFITPKANQKAALLLPAQDYRIAKQKFYPISTIIFLNRKTKGNSQLKEITKTQAIGKLFVNWRNKHLFPNNPLENLFDIIDNVNTFELKNVDFAQSLELIEKL